MIHKTQLDKLREKRIEIEENYKIAKQRRIEIVKSMEDLDARIEELDQTIELSKKDFKEKHFNKLKFKNIFKSYLVITLLQWSIALLIGSTINLFILGKFGVELIGVISSGVVISLLNVIQYTKNIATKKELKKKIKKVKFKDLEKLEQTKINLIEQRISKGAEYKRARDEEVLREKIYKQLDPILAVEITRISIGETSTFNKKNISTKDIYHKIRIEYSFYEESIENQKIILDNELKKYISLKICELYNNVINPNDLEFLTTEELIQMLIKEIPSEMHNDILSNIIHAILNFAGNLQGYSVVWYEEKNMELINTPEIVFDKQGLWTELKTHKNTSYNKIFALVYNTFLSSVMKTVKTKKRK